MTKQVKIIVEKHEDGFVAYPIGIEGVVVGEGNTYDEALSDAKSAIKFHVETFGSGSLCPATVPHFDAGCPQW